MYDEVIKFGASIVDNLRVYNSPVFIYIPPFGELRGGAWVVVDPVINHNGCVEMFADPNARGGILEPAGIVEIKFRTPDVVACMRRNRPDLVALAATDPTAAQQAEERLLPLYRDVAVQFADLHDTPGRMQAKGCIAAVVPWKQARRVFHAKLVRKLKELQFAADLAEAAEVSLKEGIEQLRALFATCFANAGDAFADDAAFMAWAGTPAAAALVAAAVAASATKRAVAAVLAGQAEGNGLADVCAALVSAGGADFAAAMSAALKK
jgi:acetyl-CoA carboxylase/biotin carboxylase 1